MTEGEPESMKALILNSGLGSRMGEMVAEHPKCMTQISPMDTILSRQLKMLVEAGVTEVVITTGPFADVLEQYCEEFNLPLHIRFVKNERYWETNYIYSIYCAKEYLEDDILLMHGDLVFEWDVLRQVAESECSCMVVDSSCPLPEKDFKAVVQEGVIDKIGIEYFTDAVAAQPLYKLMKKDWLIWLESMEQFCISGNCKCYAENAFNVVSDKCSIYPKDVKGLLCSEVDNTEDLSLVSEKLCQLDNRTVYMAFSTDILHGGHIALIRKARMHGKLIVGVLTDKAVASYKRYPLLAYEERRTLLENISGVYRVVEQNALDYSENLKKYRPDFVVHGDDWKEGFMKPIRDQVEAVLNTYGGKLVEYPYDRAEKYVELEKRARAELSLPDIRRARLKKLIEMKGLVTAMEAHSGITGLIVEHTMVYDKGAVCQFDAMWLSSLCDSTVKGKPDIELVDMTSRFRTIDDIMEVTTKPIIFDGDTGGLTEHFVYTVKSLERMGVSMVIIEDKTGLKKNSLFGTDVAQTQDTIANFCEKIKAGKRAQKSPDFMIVARIESLILKKGVADALERAFAYVGAGADGIMIHSKEKEPDEIFEFVEKFRKEDSTTPIVVVPTTFNSVTEEELEQRGVNVVIYANQLTRSGFPAMKHTAETILKNHRAQEADAMCMSIKEILTLIPEDPV